MTTTKNSKKELNFATVFTQIRVPLIWGTVFFLSEWLNLFGDATPYRNYEMPFLYPSVFPALLSCVFGLTLVIFIARQWANRAPQGPFAAFLNCLLLGMLYFPLNAIRVNSRISIKYPAFSSSLFKWLYPKPALGIPIFILGIFLLWIVWSRCRGILDRSVRTVGLVLLPVLFILFGNLMVIWSQNRVIPFLSRGLDLEVAGGKPPVHVVWIIFDELDQRLAFEKRPSEIALPEFDRLQRESLSFSQAFPPAGNTIESIPGLLTGRALHFVKFEPQDMILAGTSGSEMRFSSTENVFGAIKKLGYQTGLVGWFHPYCSVFEGQLDVCFRNTRARFDYSPSLFRNIGLILRRSVVVANLANYLHADDVTRLARGAKKIASNPNFGLSFIHLPIPHAPWIFNTRANRIDLRVSQSPPGYLDNLVLTDKILGEIRSAMEVAGVWDGSVVIVSSDHGWRASEAYDGKKDPRVPLYVHMPDHKSLRVTEKVPSFLTAPFVLALLEKKITDTAGAARWFRNQSEGFEPDYQVYHLPMDD